jgi:hypothetical protein
MAGACHRRVAAPGVGVVPLSVLGPQVDARVWMVAELAAGVGRRLASRHAVAVNWRQEADSGVAFDPGAVVAAAAGAAYSLRVGLRVDDACRLADPAVGAGTDEHGPDPADRRDGAGQSSSGVAGTKGGSGNGCPNSRPH